MSQTIEELARSLGQSVRSRRLRQRLTQAGLAERANVALGALQALEQGRNSTTATLLKVLRALGETEWLDGLSPPDPTFSPIDLLEQRRATTKGPPRVRHSKV